MRGRFGRLKLRQRLVCRQEGFEDFQILLRLLIGRKMAAFLEKDDLRTGDGVRHAPRSQRSDVHIVAARLDQGREVKTRELWREIEILGGLLDGAPDRGDEAKSPRVRDMGV